MKKPERTKAYKENEPLDTINTVREKLARVNVFTVDEDLVWRIPKVFVSRVWFGDDEVYDLGIGTNGKGMTERFALASGYGEFMERLQNGFLIPHSVNYRTYCGEHSFLSEETKTFLKENKADLQYLFAKDEKWLSCADVLKECEIELSTMLHIGSGDVQGLLLSIYGDKMIPCLQFTNIMSHEKKYFPIEIAYALTGTNGMCAGNTKKEAIIQGLSEVYERYAQYLIFRKNPEIPTIPDDLFEETEVRKKLRMLENLGFQFDILDLSMGLGLPVIGLRIKRPDDGAYSFRLGGDPSPITALERCLTETFQCDEKILDQRFTKNPCKSFESLSKGKELHEFISNYINVCDIGIGDWPSNMYSESENKFSGFQHPVSFSYDNDYAFMIDIAYENNYAVWVRDNSILGFPSYYILVPGMSEIDYSFDENVAQSLIARFRFQSLSIRFLRLFDADKSEIDTLKDAFKKYLEVELRKPYAPARWIPPGCDLPKILIDPKELRNYFRTPNFLRKIWLKEARREMPSCPSCELCNMQNKCKAIYFAKIVKQIQEYDKTE